MDMMLDAIEARVLGSLIEKEMTTPEYYPLSLNALVNACNQKSNRDPVVSFDEATVEQALDRLQQKGLALRTQAGGSRVPKYMHTLLDRLDLSKEEMALMCELLVRGPQTVGELRGRSERMSPLATIEEAERTLAGMAEHDPPLVRRLPREPGRKEARFTQLLSGGSGTDAAGTSPIRAPRLSSDDRTRALEERVAQLSSELEELREAFNRFKAQF